MPLFQLQIDAALSLPLMQVTFPGWRRRHAFTSLAFLGLAYAADFPGHLFLRYSLLGDFLLGFPDCHVDSSSNESDMLARWPVYGFVCKYQQEKTAASTQLPQERQGGVGPLRKSLSDKGPVPGGAGSVLWKAAPLTG